MADERAELLDLVLRFSFERRRVVLSSGRESDFYLDLRTTLMRPRGLALAGRLMLGRLRQGESVDAVGGMVVAAVPLVAAVLAAAADADDGWRELVGFFVRKEAKGHGLGKRIEGAFRAGQRVALVEDTMTTGGSTMTAVEAVRAEGCEVALVITVVDRQKGGAELYAKAGIPFEAVITLQDITG